MKIQESAENYLETILVLRNRHGSVHAIDIANELSFSKPSVSVAMRNLRENGYITVDSSNNISLTPQGLVIAETIYERHTCRMEHVISAESFSAIKQHVLSKGAPETEESAS